MDPSTGFTCMTCHLVFKTAELQKEHYRTDWHRYNLKRQVSDLPPITAEQFRNKILAYSTEKEAQKKEEEDVAALYCAACRKKVKSRNALADHIASKKHKEKEKDTPKGPKQFVKKSSSDPTPSITEERDMAIPSEGEISESSDESFTEQQLQNLDDIDFDESQALPITSCLFCPHTTSSKEQAAEHMRFHHGFTLPDEKYLVDKEGMLEYLGLKVGAGRRCIFCPEIRHGFATIAACQAHMRDKQHCKVNSEPEGMLEFSEYYDYSPMYHSEGVGVSDAFTDDGWTLTLPSGAKIGHRSLMMYYRQYLRPTENGKPNIGKTAIDKARGLYPALSWTGSTGVVAKQAARDLQFIQRYRRRFDLRVLMRSNKLFVSRGRKGDN